MTPLLIGLATLPAGAQQQTFSGRISDSACGASHHALAAKQTLTDRQCLFACIHALATYVLVDSDGNVIPIANQDAIGLPLYAGRPVRLTGERRSDRIVVAKIEAIPAHLHLGHVMTNWRDTPGGRGFLPVALDEARVAVLHAGLAAKSTQLDDIKLHAAHALHAIDPSVASAGPGGGYGIRKAAAGAQQHLGMASSAEGTTANIATHAASVAASLKSVLQWAEEAVAIAQRIGAATGGADAARFAGDLEVVIRRINDEGLRRAQTEMDLMLRGEGLAGAPR